MMIPLPHIAGKIYAVLGLGKSGLASAQSLLASGAAVWAWDDLPASRDASIAQGISLYDLADAEWARVTALVMSPGIPHTHPAPHPIAAAAKAANVPLISDVELLFQAQPNAIYIGITGTNGKSTTTALIGHILQQAGKACAVGGNLGTPVLSFSPLDEGGVYVLELSSYQLELIHHNPLTVAVLLNITPDHLARHGGMNGYSAAKQRIIRQDGAQVFICGMDDEASRAVAASVKNPAVTVQGISQREQPECAVFVRDGQLIMQGEAVLNLAELSRLVGSHNWQNIAAAFAATRAVGIEAATIISGIRSFAGLAHRQQWVAQHKQVQFINDSKATNAEATAMALVCYEPIYWIVGGQPKEGGLNGLEPHMPRIRQAFLIGQAAPEFAIWLAANNVPHMHCDTLDKAVAQAAAMALAEHLPHATVLLSPACASWDQFKSFEDRGEQFIKFVHDSVVSSSQVAS